MQFNNDPKNSHPGPWESILILITAYFITYFMVMSVAGLINPEVIKNPDILISSKWFFIVTQLILILIPFLYFHLKGYNLIKIFRIKKIDKNSTIWTVIFTIGILPIIDELDRLMQRILNFDELDESFFDVFRTDTPTDFILIFLTIVILAPIFEEFFFRGVLLQSFEKKVGIINAIIFSSLFWALFHPVLSWIIQIFILGLLLGVLSFHFKSTLPSIIIHGLNNLFSLILLNLEKHPIISYYESNGHVHFFWIIIGLILTFTGGKKLFAEPPVSS